MTGKDGLFRKILAFVLALALLAGITPVSAYALEFTIDKDGNLFAEDEKGFYYLIPEGKENSGECTLYVYGGQESDLVLPEKCDSYAVTTVGKDFSSMVEYVGGEMKSLTTVIIPSGYTTIESGDGGKSGAFQNQKELYCVEIPESVTSIGKDAFAGCDMSKLTIVTPKGSYAAKYAKKYGINCTTSKKVAIDPKGKTMYAGDKKTVRVYNNRSKVSWRSSKPSVAAVSQDGVITARKAGSTTISAKIGGKKYSFKLTVRRAKKGAAASTVTYAVTNLRQTEAGTNSFRVSWDGVLGAAGYELEVRDERGNTVSGTTLLTHETVTKNISPATHYTVCVRPRGGMWSEVDVVTKPAYKRNEGKLVRETDGNSATELSVSWKACEGADAYCVLYWDRASSADSAKSMDIAGETSCKLTGLVRDTTYDIRVYPYCISRAQTPFVTLDTSDAAYASGSDYAMIPGKIREVGLEDYLTYAQQAKLTWAKSKAAEGYQWEVRSGSKKIDGGTQKQNYVYATKLSANKFYKVRVRGYIQIDGEKAYGAWSDWQYVSSQPKKLSYKQSSGRLSLSWSKVSGATSYTVYVSSKKPSDIREMKKVKTVKKNSYTLKKLGGKSVDGKKRYYIVVVANKETKDAVWHSISKYIYQTK